MNLPSPSPNTLSPVTYYLKSHRTTFTLTVPFTLSVVLIATIAPTRSPILVTNLVMARLLVLLGIPASLPHPPLIPPRGGSCSQVLTFPALKALGPRGYAALSSCLLP